MHYPTLALVGACISVIGAFALWGIRIWREWRANQPHEETSETEFEVTVSLWAFIVAKFVSRKKRNPPRQIPTAPHQEAPDKTTQ
jgi:hypothetical protein